MVRPKLSRLLFNASSSSIRAQWNLLSSLPGGRALFSKAIGTMAPYTGTIGAHIEELRPGYSRVTLRDRHKVRNHLRSVHAIALTNLAELAGNVALLYSMPPDARFIVAGLSMDYVKKARGTITAISECPVPSTNERQEYQVPVTLRDAQGEVVATATLRSLVGPV